MKAAMGAFITLLRSENIASPREVQMNAILETNRHFVISRGQQLAVLWIRARSRAGT